MNYYKYKYLKYKKKLGGSYKEKIEDIIEKRVKIKSENIKASQKSYVDIQQNNAKHLYRILDDIRADCHPDTHLKYIDTKLLLSLQ